MNETIDTLRKKLEADDAEIRRRAVMDLASFTINNAVPLILDALGDEDWRVRKEAAVLATRNADFPPLVDGLIEAVGEEDNIGLKNAAQEALSNAGDRIIDAVARLLQDGDAESRKVAVDILGSLKTARAQTLLMTALDDTDLNVRIAATEMLGVQNDKRFETPLLRSLADPHAMLRITALQSLCSLDIAISFEQLKPLLSDAILSDELLPALGRCGAVEAVLEIMKYLADAPAACLALETLHAHSPETADAVEAALSSLTDDARRTLLALSQSADVEIARAAVRCILWSKNLKDIPNIVTLARNSPLYHILVEGLAAWGKPAVDALTALLSTETDHRLASVIGLLSRLLDEKTGRRTAFVFAKYLSSAHPAVSTAAASAVARFGDETVVPSLAQLAGLDDDRIRGAAGMALVEIGKRFPEAVRSVVEIMPLNGAVGVQICKVLESVGTEADLPRVFCAVDAKDVMLRRAALRTAAAVGKARALDHIAAALTDPDLTVRLAASDAIALIGEPAQDLLVRALADAEGPTAAALVRSLGKVGHPDAEKILTGMCRKSADLILCAVEAAVSLDIPLKALRQELLHHPDEEVVKAALNAFGKNIPWTELSELLGRDSWDLRLRAAEELGERTDEAGVLEVLRQRIPLEENDLVQQALIESAGKPPGERG